MNSASNILTLLFAASDTVTFASFLTAKSCSQLVTALIIIIDWLSVLLLKDVTFINVKSSILLSKIVVVYKYLSMTVDNLIYQKFSSLQTKHCP